MKKTASSIIERKCKLKYWKKRKAQKCLEVLIIFVALNRFMLIAHHFYALLQLNKEKCKYQIILCIVDKVRDALLYTAVIVLSVQRA